ncbi:MAG TPA: BTAD domain-containing putative transcriptional regulator [Solirubrobacterales bacterium]|nr:BTAD domain-containing putative transcriptional regulator [Solirubrobacterales bacterium]
MPVLDTEGLSLSSTLVEQFMFGLMLVGPDRRVRYLNHKARQLLLPPQNQEVGSWSCCELICDRLAPLLGGCLSEQVRTTEEELPEVRLDVESERLETAAWVTVCPTGSDLLFHLRPGRTGDRRRRTDPIWTGDGSSRERAELRISTLGKVEVEGPNGPVNGSWLEQRPGQLLKYLLCERRRVLTSDQAVEALWPDAGIEEGQSRLRYTVHALRDKLEPDRPPRSTGRFVVARRGGYVFDTNRVWLDVDEFEREARAGLAAYEQSQRMQAAESLNNALRLYRGDFLTDERYADWALEEQERLRGLAARVMRSQARIDIELGRLEVAGQHTRRLAELDPLDNDVNRLMVEICLRRGRRSEAQRRYAYFKRRMGEAFGCEPDFKLGDVERQIAKPAQGAELSPEAGLA